MKNNSKFLLFSILAAAITASGFVTPFPSAPVAKKFYPKKVNAIIQDKCYGCHNPNSKGEKSRKKLNWDELSTLSASEKHEKLNKIMEVLDKGEMPPKFMLDKHPEKKLTAKETAKLKKWASKLAKKLSK